MSVTMARARTSTRAAPARFKAAAQAPTVAPVVTTSSTAGRAWPRSGRLGAGTAKAPATLRASARASGPPGHGWRACARAPAARRRDARPGATSRARIAAWLKRRMSSRQRPSGTGTTISASRNELGSGFDEPAAEQPARVVAVAEFQVVDRSRMTPVVASDRARAVVGRRVGSGRGRDHGAAGIERHRQAQAIAQRRADEVDAAPAVGAERVVGGEGRAAGKAERRHDEVGERLRARGERSASPPAGSARRLVFA